MLTDDELLSRIADRDERAFALLYERHIHAARTTARRACRELADDALQEAFFALWRDAGSFRARPGGAAGFLHTIVRNRAVDLRRQADVRERRFVHAEDTGVELRSPEGAVLAREEHARLRAAVTGLPGPQREVILLAYAGGLTQPEIAARQSVALGTVKGRSRLALRRLAAAMG
ncbi:RNA polymerase sigma factor [Solirubrobacter phytolaccae]|uniref:RNA polymerase sigma factor n=1 Tax=Solirubrobacter phytolaccae TaxID=1404360 RepID=A0A9X3SDJ4_9ACTN|nr:RNA polymerase sigma factor [Solirubrobacter phytolaccae]MDA0179762.1 RNA polymerase sigma factor [Solirubrobacter phytolaccae]